jgi:putative 4-mercaptohistidine N1-methyltranferase
MSPVNALPPNSKGFHDVFGNAWEWTEDYFSALPGFQVHPFYEDFSTPCFDGLHHVITGGSFMSTGNEASVHARFHFRPHFYQHASFRLVEAVDAIGEMVTTDMDAPGPYVGNYPFRRSHSSLLAQLQQGASGQAGNSHGAVTIDQLTSQYFGTLPSVFPASLQYANVAKNITAYLQNHMEGGLQGKRILDVGCAVGALTFAFAQCQAESVIGIDHNKAAIDLAKGILKEREIQYNLPFAPGSKETQQMVTMLSADATIVDVAASKVSFRQADAMCLPAEMQGFDIVVLQNVLSTVSSPNSVLGRLAGVRGLLRTGGMLVVLDKYDWVEERTPRSLWIGGYTEGGKYIHPVQALTERLKDEFDFQHKEEVSIVWRETLQSFKGEQLYLTVYKRTK